MFLKFLLVVTIMITIFQLTSGNFFGRNFHIQLPFFGLDITKDPVVNKMDCDDFKGFLFDPFRNPFINRRRYQAFNREVNEKCPPLDQDCLCVSSDICYDGFIVNDGRTLIKKRGKRHLNTGLEVDVHKKQKKNSEARSIDWKENKNFGIFVKPPFRAPDLTEGKEFSSEFNDINPEMHETSVNYKTTQGILDEEEKKVENSTDLIEIEETSKKTFLNYPEIEGSRRNFCPYNMVCCKTGSDKSKAGRFFEKCGQRRACGIERKSDIFSRRGEADFGEWPWQVALIKKKEDGKREFFCNGVLVDSKRVLTVAQCFSQNQSEITNLEVRVGDLDLSTTFEPRYHKNYNIKSISIHPNYNGQSLRNDIAIIHLTSFVELKEHISPICLPKKGEQFAKDSCVVTGWMKNYALLKESYSNYLDHKECEVKMQSSKLGPFFSLHSNFICAVDAGIVCRMKGGAPMVCKRNDGSLALVGLLSWGIDCNGDEAEVFTKVQNHIEWLEKEENLH